MKTYARYAEQYSKRRGLPTEKTRVMTTNDNETYQQFLEVQLEKVTNALLMTKEYEERILKLEKGNVNFDEKMGKLMTMVKLLQNFAEAQEGENSKILERFQEKSIETEQNLNRIESLIGKIEPRFRGFEAELLKISEKVDSEIYDEIKHLGKGLQEVRTGNGGRKSMDESLDRFREEMNQKIEMVMTEMQKSALSSDLEDVQRSIEEERKEREVLFEQINREYKISQDLLEDISRKCKSIEENNNACSPNHELKKSLGEDNFECVLKLSKLEKEIDDLKYSTHLINTKLSKSLQGPSTKDLQNLEKSMIQQFSKGLDQFGEIIKKYVNNQKDVNIRLNSIEKEFRAKSPFENQMLKKYEKIENPFTQNKENCSTFSNQNQSIEKKKTNFQEYLRNSKYQEKDKLSDSSSDLEEFLIKRDKSKKIKPKTTEKSQSKRSKSASNMKKNEKKDPKIKESNSRSVKRQRKHSPGTSQSLLNRISIERKEKEQRIKEMMRKEKRAKLKP